MSSSVPPTGPQGPEYLEQGSGAPITGRPGPGISRTKALVAGGAVIGIALVGGGVWAAMSFFGQGAQPAEALPASTLGYAAIDLDPSGGQKIEAIRMLKKFPAFEEEIGLDTDDDLRQRIFEEAGLEEQCDGLSYADDVEPWLGDRFAVAAVDLGEQEPTVAAVVQVKDAGAAEDGMAALRECAGAEETGAWVIEGDWAVVAETESIAQEITDATAEGSLADDADYQEWTDEVGDAGVVNLYAAPEAGAYLADSVEGLVGLPGASEVYSSDCVAAPGEDSCEELPVIEEPASPGAPEELSELLEDFGGMAATLRFDDGALELEIAGDAELTQQGFAASDAGDDVLATLPADTAAAFGVGFADGWLSDYLDRMASWSGMELDELIAEAEAETGLDLPEDGEILAGESAAFAVGPDLDGDALVNSETPEGLPIGVKVKGDPEAIEEVLDKLRTSLGPDAEFLVSEGEGDVIAIGADDGYVAELLEDGDLGGNDTFQNVVREAEDAGSILYVNFDAGDGWLVEIAGDDAEAAENLEPLEGLGVSGWVEDEAGHVLLRLTTD